MKDWLYSHASGLFLFIAGLGLYLLAKDSDAKDAGLAIMTAGVGSIGGKVVFGASGGTMSKTQAVVNQTAPPPASTN